MSIPNRLKNQHLLWRAGFGPMAENIADLDTLSQKTLWATLINTSAETPRKIDIAKNPLTDSAYMNSDGTPMNPANLDKDQKKMLIRQYKEDLKDMNIAWLNMMISSKAQLREKMSFFWHGHFACRSRNGFFAQELVNIIRENATGNFGDMLRAVVSRPQCCNFLIISKTGKDTLMKTLQGR